MTEILTKLIVNCETGEQTRVPLSAEEIASLEASRAESELREAERLAAEAEAQALKDSANAKLAALGLTADEIAAITR
jgi:hypothetical protein